MSIRNIRGFVAVVLIVCAMGCAASKKAVPGPPIIDQMRERILAHLDLKPGTKVAEIGVGPGWFVIRVAQKIGSDGIVYGTDIDAARIDALRQHQSDIGPGRVDLRLCRDPRDTALDDLPDNHLDLVLMIDSLCFDADVPREQNVAYLHRFLRVLRPGGRLVHHMDCRCDVTTEGLGALFADAGFSPRLESFDVAPDPTMIDASWPCRSGVERTRHAFVGVFTKP